MSSREILDLIHHGFKDIVEKWKGFSEIQLKAIPVILKGNDCIVEAPTAGGKTEAVLFPALTRAAGDKKESVQVLYLAPLRALLNDIEKRAEKYAGECGLKCFKWHGDVDQKEKIKQFLTPPHLLLTTPESLEAILLRKAGWTKLFAHLEIVIIDEAHNFASGDRGGHLATLLERLERALNRQFQRIALTATVGNPDDMLRWLAGSNREPGIRVHVPSRLDKDRDYQVKFFDSKMDDIEEMEKSHVREFKSLYELLPHRKSIVFCKSRKKTEELATAVQKMNDIVGSKNRVKVRTHHSSVSKFYREAAEELIKIREESGLQAVISTSTLELGIDIGELDQVIQVGSLVSSSSFLQRVGRTGRRAGKKQFFRGLCTSRKELLLLTAVVNLGLRGISEFLRLSRRAYHLLAHQLICLSLQNNGIRREEAWRILSGAYCFFDITEHKFHELVETMVEEQYLRDVDGELIIGETGERVFLGSNWRRLFACFDSAAQYDVIEGKNQVGTLDAAFVESLSVPFLFVLGGFEWEAEKVNTKSRQVLARRKEAGVAPRWHVFAGSDVPRDVAMEAGRILFEKDFPDFLDIEARDGISAERDERRSVNWQEGKWVATFFEGGVLKLWTYAGDRINRTLALLLGQREYGKAVSTFENIEVKTESLDRDYMVEVINELLLQVKQMNSTQLDALNETLSQTVPYYNFSKFSKCLPRHLSLEAMAEKSIDVAGLKNELINTKIEFLFN